MAWYGFSKRVGRTHIAKELKIINAENNNHQLINENKENVDAIWINLLYLGAQADQLLLSRKRKITC